MVNPHAEIFRRSEPMDIAMRFLKAPFYEYSMPTSQITENIVPFAEAMNEGEEDWQYIQPRPPDARAREHLAEQMKERNIAQTSPALGQPIIPGDEDTLHIGNLIAELMMRENPEILGQLPPGARASMHWGNFPKPNIIYPSEHSKQRVPYPMKDLHSVFYQIPGGKVSPITIQPTPPFRVTEPTQFIPAGSLAEWQKEMFDARNLEHGLETPALRDLHYQRPELVEAAGAAPSERRHPCGPLQFAAAPSSHPLPRYLSKW